MISWWFKPQAGVILISLWLCKSVHFWQTRQWCQEMTITATQVRSSMVCNISQAPEHTLLYSTNTADKSTVDTYAAMQIINWNKWVHVKSTELWSCSHSRVTANRLLPETRDEAVAVTTNMSTWRANNWTGTSKQDQVSQWDSPLGVPLCTRTVIWQPCDMFEHGSLTDHDLLLLLLSISVFYFLVFLFYTF